jgi:hypothetical protein
MLMILFIKIDDTGFSANWTRAAPAANPAAIARSPLMEFAGLPSRTPFREASGDIQKNIRKLLRPTSVKTNKKSQKACRFVSIQ